MLYLIGTILEIIVLIMSAFAPVLYTQNFEYGKITGIGKVYVEGDKVTYDLFSIMGAWYIILILVVAGNAILFLVFYFKKMSHNIPGFLLSILYALPIAFMIIGASILGSEAKFIGGGGAVYGSGYNTGFTGFGWIVLLLMIAAIILTIIGIISQRAENQMTPYNDVKVVTKNNSTKKYIREDDFKM